MTAMLQCAGTAAASFTTQQGKRVSGKPWRRGGTRSWCLIAVGLPVAATTVG
jgi:hypothetical protein